jgi:iron complex outermembrane receptor protein
MKQIRQLVLGILFLIPLLMSSQEIIKGKVTDPTGLELPGVSVVIKGTNKGTATDFDGKFELRVDDANAIITFSFIGYVNQEVPASAEMNIIMEESSESLDEIILIGYGQTTKKDATGSVEKVGVEQFNGGAILSPEQLISGKTAGVNVIPPSGKPGSTGTIKIRGGNSSLNANNNPLIVVDGVPMDQDGNNAPGLSTINPNDIESFVILKDASATAIYGSRASAGVILITTKTGHRNAPLRAEFSTFVSVGTRENQVSVLNAEQFTAAVNSQGIPNSIALLGDDDTNWQDQIYRTAIGTDNNFTLSQGFDNSSFRASFGYTYQEGLIKTDDFKRKSASLNYRINLVDDTFKINFNIRGTVSDNNNADGGALGNSLTMDPTQPVYSGSPSYGGYWEWLDNDGTPNAQAPKNPLGLLEQNSSFGQTQRYIGNVKFDYDFPVEGLKANLNLGFDYAETDGYWDVPASSASGFDDNGSSGTWNSLRRSNLLDFYVNYLHEFEKPHKIDVMVGYSYQDFYRENQNYQISGLGTETETNFATTNGLLSYFTRLNYAYDNRYLVTFTYRRDGSSRFSPENRWGNFFSGAIAWSIADEEFLRDSETISTLKLRIGYGETGQQEIGSDFGYLPTYRPGQDNVRYQFGDRFINTLRPEGYDSEIKWEESATSNIGIDYGFLNDRVTGSLEYYIRKTTDVLSTVSPPAGSNLTNSLFTNIGDLENSGIEFSVNADIFQHENFVWNVNFNATYLQNKITKLNAVEDPDSPGIPVGGIRGGVGNNIQTQQVGQPQFSYLVYKQVYDSDGNPLQGVYEDLNGDGQWTDLDKRIYKNPNPDYLMGLSSYMNYKNWDLNFVLRASLGNHMYNNIASSEGNSTSLYFNGTNRNIHTSYLDTGFTEVQLWSDYYIQDASFLKMDNVVLGYNFNNLKEGEVIFRIYGSVQNAFVITEYDGLDPEISGGIDNNFYPRPRTYLLGFNVNF